MKRFFLCLLSVLLCFSMFGCESSEVPESESFPAVDAAALQDEIDRLTEENQKLSDQVEELQDQISQMEEEAAANAETDPTPLVFVDRISKYLDEEYSVMKYKADELVENPFNDDNLQLPVRLYVDSEVENTGVSVYFGTTDEEAVIDSLALYASPDVNTVYFNNVLSALLFVSNDLFSLDISDSELKETVSSMTEKFSSGGRSYMGHSDDRYSIMMRPSTDEFGLETYVVSVSVK